MERLETLFDARKRKGISQETLAITVGMSSMQISNLENGKCRPRKSTRRALENALDTKIDWS